MVAAGIHKTHGQQVPPYLLTPVRGKAANGKAVFCGWYAAIDAHNAGFRRRHLPPAHFQAA